MHKIKKMGLERPTRSWGAKTKEVGSGGTHNRSMWRIREIVRMEGRIVIKKIRGPN